MTKSINHQQVILLHKTLLSKTGGMNGIKDEGLIISALERHMTT